MTSPSKPSTCITTGLVALAFMFCITGAVHSQCRYDVTLLRHGDDTLIPEGINDHGVVVGRLQPGGVGFDRAFVWTQQDDARVIQFPLPTSQSKAFDINNAGVIVGNVSWLNPPALRGFVLDGDTLTEIDALPGTNLTEAYSLNEAGQVACRVVDFPTDTARGALWDAGQLTIIEPPFGPRSHAWDINEDGVIVGWIGSTETSDSHAIVFDHGDLIDLGTINDALAASLQSVNSHLYIAGSRVIKNRIFPSGKQVLGIEGTVELPDWFSASAPFDTNFAREVNNNEQIVGYFREILGSRFADQAYIRIHGVAHILNDFSNDPTIDIRQVFAINDFGQIVGFGVGENIPFGAVGFLLTPVDSPAGDVDRDCHVDVHDLLAVLAEWNHVESFADADGDGFVDIEDLLIVISEWG